MLIHKAKYRVLLDVAPRTAETGPLRSTWCDDEYLDSQTSQQWRKVTCPICLMAKDEGDQFPKMKIKVKNLKDVVNVP